MRGYRKELYAEYEWKKSGALDAISIERSQNVIMTVTSIITNQNSINMSRREDAN